MRVLFDATTTLAWADRPPVGTVRVERLVLADLCRTLPPDRLGFVKFRHGRFVPVSLAQGERIRALAASPLRQLSAPVAAERDGEERRPGLKRLVRRWARRQLEGSRPAQRDTEPLDFPGFTDFVTLGQGWDYLDHAHLARLKAQNGLRVHGFVHDLIAVHYPHFFHDPNCACSLRRHYAELCRLADGLVANSFATKAALEAFIADEGLPRPALHVAQLPAFLDADADDAALPEALRGERFVLYVSTIEVRKNHRLLLRLWSEQARQGTPLPRLVLVGRTGWGADEALAMLRWDPALAGNVLHLDEVGDDLLAALYRRCLFAVYPSTIEGWGLPITEAMAYGKMCVHADDPAQREAAQGLMPCCHPDDYARWKEAITAFAGDDALRGRLERKIAERFRPRTVEAFCSDMRAALGLG
jgi:glycosyltransferase involved in cell wall biosynthesis